MNVRIYVEGGGDSKELRTRCREGFSKLLAKAGLAGRMPRIVACGGRKAAYDAFQSAIVSADSYPMLLIDSEDPVKAGTAWDHLQARDRWTRPTAASDDQAHLMVTSMETWLVADRSALRHEFGSNLREKHLPALNDLEDRSRHDVLQALEHATRDCGRVGRYSKGPSSFRIMTGLDPAILEKHLPHFRKLVAALKRHSW